jgi:hypothetical protein
MPYEGQSAGKGGHSDFVRNPDVQEFLSKCKYMREPSDKEGKEMASSFIQAPTSNGRDLPAMVVASDASKKDDPIFADMFPSTQIGFIKISHVLINLKEYQELCDASNRFVDPLRAAKLHNNAHPVTFILPGSNIFYNDAPNGRTGFRVAVYEQLSKPRSEGSNGRTLTDTLVSIWGPMSVPTCRECLAPGAFNFSESIREVTCPSCGSTNFVTDILRLDENISDFGNNTSAITRMMNAVEHLFLAHFLIDLSTASLQSLAKIAFVMDGPLAVFGEPASLHSRIMRLIASINEKLMQLGLEPMLIIGLQKTGAVMEHAMVLKRHLPNGVLRVVDDDYRNKYISRSDAPNFGGETYYGQDFIFKTERGNIFNFAVPYPFHSKGAGRGEDFAKAKVDLSLYGSLIGRACDLIRHFEMDLYTSAIVPVALAHRHASISLVPGGKVLDILSKVALDKNTSGQ